VVLLRPSGEFLALARAATFTLSGTTYRLLAGVELSRARLAELVPDPEVTTSLRIGSDVRVSTSEGTTMPPAELERSLELPARVADVPDARTARITFAHSLSGRHEVLDALDRRLLLAFGAAAAAALALATVLAARLARPVEGLAEKARAVDLDHLNVDFATARRDEIGALSRFLQEMTERLRANVSRLREAERRAALGDLARQVNHDLKNAFPPIRNVVQHLGDVAHEPAELARVFAERRGTLDSGLAYLEELSANWRKLAGRPERTACDMAAVAREAAAGRARVDAGANVPRVHADGTALRRVVDNLVTNAVESGAAHVAVIVRADAGPPPSVLLVVEDDGPGIPAGVRERAFEPYWTTKPGGTGLGLAIVRRLVADAEGSVRIDDRDGRGTRITVTLPAGGAA
jgi:signal transduction histidine kinase